MPVETDLWRRLRDDLARLVGSLVERRRVLGFDDDGKVRIASTDPRERYTASISRLRGAALVAGEDCLTIRLGGVEVIVDGLGGAGEAEGIVGGDGSSPLAARLDHEHASDGTESTALGVAALTAANQATALGSHAKAEGVLTVAVGYAARAVGMSAVALGRNATALGERSIAVGQQAYTPQPNAVSIGAQSQATQDGGIALGDTAQAIAGGAVAVGKAAATDGFGGVALGQSADSNGWGSIALGNGADTTGDYGMALGYDATAGARGIALGASATAAADQAKVKANDLEVERSNGGGQTRLILRTPNGSRRALVISDTGTVSTVAL